MKHRIPLYACLVLAYLVASNYGWPPNLNARTIKDVVAVHQAEVKTKLAPYFQKSGLAYPPKKIRLVADKTRKILDLYAAKDDLWVKIKSYPFTSFSGVLGPKLKEGDGQIPEGIYTIEYLNPNSRFHLSMKLNYPNSFDKEMGKRDGRTNIGSDIFLHGSNVTIGCIPIGNRNIEELFVLVALTGKDNTSVIITPYDMATGKEIEIQNKTEWLDDLYVMIRKELEKTGGILRD